MRDIIIIGAGGFGREVKCLIEDINQVANEKEFNILGFVDDGIETGTHIHQYQVLGGISYLENLVSKPLLVLGIGNPAVKEKIYSRLKTYDFPTLVHPSVSLSGYNIAIGQGCVICKGTQITCDVELLDFVTVNLCCTIGHDSIVKNFSSLMPSVNISGEVVIEEKVFIGTGVEIINRVHVGRNAIIGAGAVVSKAIPENCTAVGIPAKPIKFNS